MVGSVVPGSVVPGLVVPGSVVPGLVVPGTVVPFPVIPGPEPVVELLLGQDVVTVTVVYRKSRLNQERVS